MNGAVVSANGYVMLTCDIHEKTCDTKVLFKTTAKCNKAFVRFNDDNMYEL